jgi:L-asparagine oxygenase
LIFKNQRVTHSRESFAPRFDGADRWLLRLFGINDLKRTVPVNKEKPYCVAA